MRLNGFWATRCHGPLAVHDPQRISPGRRQLYGEKGEASFRERRKAGCVVRGPIPCRCEHRLRTQQLREGVSEIRGIRIRYFWLGVLGLPRTTVTIPVPRACFYPPSVRDRFF